MFFNRRLEPSKSFEYTQCRLHSLPWKVLARACQGPGWKLVVFRPTSRLWCARPSCYSLSFPSDGKSYGSIGSCSKREGAIIPNKTDQNGILSWYSPVWRFLRHQTRLLVFNSPQPPGICTTRNSTSLLLGALLAMCQHRATRGWPGSQRDLHEILLFPAFHIVYFRHATMQRVNKNMQATSSNHGLSFQITLGDSLRVTLCWASPTATPLSDSFPKACAIETQLGKGRNPIGCPKGKPIWGLSKIPFPGQPSIAQPIA